MSSARRSAKAEVRGANPRESASLIDNLRLMIDDFKAASSAVFSNRKSQIKNRK
jgi:hypothetical protein